MVVYMVVRDGGMYSA